IFWVSVTLLTYTYAIYPLLVWLWARLRGESFKSGAAETERSGFRPMVSVLVVAHNEASRIAQRIDNLLALDYPRDRLEIVIASDASSDGTVELARIYQNQGVRVVAFNKHRGKPGVLNDMIPRLCGEIVVLMDVRQEVEADAVKNLVANFVNPDIGAVSGELFLLNPDRQSEVGEGVGFYWRYEKFIRINESRLDSTV